MPGRPVRLELDTASLAGPAEAATGTVSSSSPRAGARHGPGPSSRAGLRFAITQSEGCSFGYHRPRLRRARRRLTAVAVQTTVACPWNQSVTCRGSPLRAGGQRHRTRSARLVRRVEPGSARTHRVVADSVVTVLRRWLQLRLSPAVTSPFAAAGGVGSAAVETGAGCGWNASTAAAWITLTGPTSGTGEGAIAFVWRHSPALHAAAQSAWRLRPHRLEGVRGARSGSGCASPSIPRARSVGAAAGQAASNVTGARAARGRRRARLVLSHSHPERAAVATACAVQRRGDGIGSRSGTLNVGGQTSREPAPCSVRHRSHEPSVGQQADRQRQRDRRRGCAWAANEQRSGLSTLIRRERQPQCTVQFSAAATSSGSRSGR